MYPSPNKAYSMEPVITSYPAPPPVGAAPGMVHGGYVQPPPSYGQPVPYPVPVVQQPTSNFYPAPGAPQQVPFGPYSNPLVPRGLEPLLTLNQLIIEQQVEMIEAFTGYETNNKYIVKNLNGQHLYYAAEENDLCTRNCLGNNRPFVMRLYDSERHEMMRFERPFRCDSCLFPCCLQQMEVFGGGQALGSIVQEWSLFVPRFSILNGLGEKVLHIDGPFITFSCGQDVEFDVMSVDRKTNVGKIKKQWSGLARELFTDADRFGIEFPRDLEVGIKAVLLAATFLIDFMYFEKSHS